MVISLFFLITNGNKIKREQTLCIHSMSVPTAGISLIPFLINFSTILIRLSLYTLNDLFSTNVYKSALWSEKYLSFLSKASFLTLPMPKGRGFLLPAEVIG